MTDDDLHTTILQIINAVEAVADHAHCDMDYEPFATLRTIKWSLETKDSEEPS